MYLYDGIAGIVLFLAKYLDRYQDSSCRHQAQSRVENTKSQIKRVLALLKKMREDVDVQIADEKEKQEQLAVETEL